jgi:tetratricopeptide (TPR) repeat protein
MNRSLTRALLLCALLCALTNCSRDPNVRKQKYFDSGEDYFAKGKYGEAVIQYSNAIKIDSHFAQAHYRLSQAYIRMRDLNDAYDELNRTVVLDPDNYKAHTDLANLLISTRNPESLKDAKIHLDILRAKQPNAPETHQAWATYDAAQNDLKSAIAESQQAIALDPSRSESYLQLALFQLGSNLPDQAEASFKKAVEIDPKAMNAQIALGSFYQSRNRLPEAEQQFQHAIEIDPKSVAPRTALVRLLMQEGKRPETEAFALKTKKDLPDNPEAYRMLGDFYFATNDLDKAAAEYGSLNQDHPKDPLVKRNYVQILILKNRLDEAAKLNNEILKSNPHDSEALVFKGQIQLRQNDAAGAIDSLQTAINNDDGNAIAHYQLGLAFNQQHDETRAEREWRRAVALRPDLTDAQRYLALLEKQRGDSAALAETAQQIINTQPASPDGFILKAIAEIDQQKFSDAQQNAGQAMQRAPQSPAPYFQMGNIHLAQKHYAEAEKFYQQSLEKDPSSVEALSGLMYTYVAQKQPDKAIAAANAQITKSPNNSGFYDLLGTALFQTKKDLPGAEAALKKAVDLDKNNNDALEKLGKVQVAEGSADQASIDRALALYQQAIKDNPGNVRFYILSGEMYETKHDWDHAKAMYQQALSLQPDQPLASNNLAYLTLQQGGNVDVALAMAQAARRGMPDLASAADTLGWAYYQKGIYQSAIGQFQEAIRLAEKHGEPDDSTVHYHLGLAYQKANQSAQARQQLEKALKLNPNNAEAHKALSELHG